MVQPEPEGFVVPVDIKKFCHPELMASIRGARSLPCGLGQVSQQPPWPAQPAADSRASDRRTGGRLRPSPRLYFPPWHRRPELIYKRQRHDFWRFSLGCDVE